MPTHQAATWANVTAEQIGNEAVNQADSHLMAVELHDAPIQPDQEWANALTHGVAAIGSLVIGAYMVLVAAAYGDGMAIACAVYMASVFGTFFCSTLSHVFTEQPTLNTMRAWDQAMIYSMISGTYTPIIYVYGPPEIKFPLLAIIWIAAAAGFIHKVALRHRINSIGTVSYLLLGWLPAMPLIGRVPSEVTMTMLAGGVVYTLGVIALINDRKMKYMHAVWHLSVMLAALLHFLGILRYVVQAS